MSFDWNLCFSTVTALTAIFAISLTLYQIQLSNKQHLFDRRLKAYIIVSGLLNLYEENKFLLKRGKENMPEYSANLKFMYLTNNLYLERQTVAIKHPLESPYHQDFLKKCEEMKALATEIKFIFNANAATLYSDFVMCYQNLLLKTYQYQVVLNQIQEKNNRNPMTSEERQKMFPHEETQREELYLAMEQLAKAYAEIVNNKVDEKIQNQLVLR